MKWQLSEGKLLPKQPQLPEVSQASHYHKKPLVQAINPSTTTHP